MALEFFDRRGGGFDSEAFQVRFASCWLDFVWIFLLQMFFFLPLSWITSISHRFTCHCGVIFDVVLILLCQTAEEVDTSGGTGERRGE